MSLNSLKFSRATIIPAAASESAPCANITARTELCTPARDSGRGMVRSFRFLIGWGGILRSLQYRDRFLVTGLRLLHRVVARAPASRQE